MFRRILSATGVAVGLLLAVSVIPAVAHTLTVTVTATCACEYTVTASGNTDANARGRVDFSFTVTSNGVDFLVSNHVDTNTDANGNFDVTVPGFTLPGDCKDTVSCSGGSANLTFNGTTETGFSVTLPSPLFCG